MNIITISSREFNQDVSRAKRSACSGPVEEYQRITDKKESIVELLAMPDVADIDFEVQKLSKNLYYPANLS